MNIRPQIPAPELMLCRDCRFYKLSFLDRITRNPDAARCHHEMSGFTNSVTGKREQKFCSDMRWMGCGAKAHLFEPKRDDVVPVVMFEGAE